MILDTAIEFVFGTGTRHARLEPGLVKYRQQSVRQVRWQTKSVNPRV